VSVLKIIGRYFGLVPIAEVSEAAIRAAQRVNEQAGTQVFPAWQIIREAFEKQGIKLQWPGQVPSAGDMRKL
jgi:hypothetical protein